MIRLGKGLGLLALTAFLILGATASSRAVKHFGRDHMKVDGVSLEYRREVDLEGTLAERFSVESALGDVRITGVEGRTARLHVEIFEYTPDDLRVELDEDGRLVFKSEGGHPGAIGEIIAELPADLSLELSTGAGDVELKGMRGPRIEIETGFGDVTLEDLAGQDRLEVSTGKGDIRMGPVEDLENVELSTGMGGIKVRDARVEDLEVSTGMGGIRLLDCALGRVSGGTGMGSVKFKRTTFDDSDVSAGLGGVSYQ